MISKMMKRKYITPVVYFFKFEEESELLGNSINKASCTNAATDVDRDIMDSEKKTGLPVVNNGVTQEQIGAKDHGWLFDDNAFSDSW